MNRYAKDRVRESSLPRVERVELSERHAGLRIGLAAVFLLLGLATLAFTFSRFVGTESGWQEITASADSELGCGEEFLLYYELGAGDVSARQEKQALSALYGTLCTQGYRLFTNDSSFEGLVNLRTINDSPNTVLTVDPVLYEALSLLEQSGSRYLYYAPLYAVLENICSAETDALAASMDPQFDAAAEAYWSEAIAFAGSPDAVSLELLGQNQLCLHVSEAYLEFAEAYAVRDFLDFYAVKNAFLTDYLADALIAAGYTDGVLSSLDGFSRSLNGGSGESSFHCYALLNGTVYDAAQITLAGMAARASLHGFPIHALENVRYYVYADGTLRTPYVTEPDGACLDRPVNLTGCADSGSCSEILCALLPVFTAEAMEVQALETLSEQGLSVILAQDSTLLTNLPETAFRGLYAADEVAFSVQPLQ